MLIFVKCIHDNYSLRINCLMLKVANMALLLRLQGRGYSRKRLRVNMYYPVNSINQSKTFINTGMIKPGKSRTIDIVNSFNTIVTSYFSSTSFLGPFRAGGKAPTPAGLQNHGIVVFE